MYSRGLRINLMEGEEVKKISLGKNLTIEGRPARITSLEYNEIRVAFLDETGGAGIYTRAEIRRLFRQEN